MVGQQQAQRHRRRVTVPSPLFQRQQRQTACATHYKVRKPPRLERPAPRPQHPHAPPTPSSTPSATPPPASLSTPTDGLGISAQHVEIDRQLHRPSTTPTTPSHVIQSDARDIRIHPPWHRRFVWLGFPRPIHRSAVSLSQKQSLVHTPTSISDIHPSTHFDAMPSP